MRLSVKILLISLISGMVLFCGSAFGQGSCYPAGVVLLDTGRPANGASVRVCTSGSTGTPCTPAASLFTDPTLGTPLGGSPTVTTDSHGNFGFCAAAGANYDLQISGTGITPLIIKNLPLPPTTPITAASLTSSSANPANVGLIKLASGDCLDWRNNANSGNVQLCKDTSDALDASAFSVVKVLGGIKQGSPTTGFSILDANGASHLFVSGTSPYQNTFVTGNGSGTVFLGSAALASVADTTGNIATSGTIAGASLALGGGTALTTPMPLNGVAADAGRPEPGGRESPSDTDDEVIRSSYAPPAAVLRARRTPGFHRHIRDMQAIAGVS